MSEILDIFDKSLKKSRAEQTELVFEGEEFYLTRFAESLIHQNMGRKDHTIWCRTVVGKKIGIAKGNALNQEAIDRLVQTAFEICQHQQDDPQFAGFTLSPKAPGTSGFAKTTADYTPDDRAKAVKTIVDIARSDKLSASGMYQTSLSQLAVANSLGTRQEGKVTEAKISITVSDDTGRNGFSQAYARDSRKLDFVELANRAVAKAARPTQPIVLEPGKYTVILDPEAVADFLLFLGFLGFGGKGIFSKRSFMAGKLGTKIMSDLVTIAEDPFNSEINYMDFDYEGVPRRKVMLVDKGIASGVVNDSYYANLNKTQSTGNALPPGNGFGPYPKAMVMSAGQKSLEQIIASTESAIWITHFWYLNYVNPMVTSVTGTTRDGTFLVESGKTGAPVEDMRISQSMLEAFNNIEEISSERRLVPKYGALMYVPALKISNFNFVAKE